MPDALELLQEGRRAEKLGILNRALEAYEDAARASDDPAIIAEALVHQADVHRACCEWDDAITCARDAQVIAVTAGLKDRHAEALNAEAVVHIARGDFPAAMPLLEKLLGAATDARLRGIALQNLGTMRAQQGQLADAEQAFVESYECFVSCGYERGQAIALNNQGRVALDRGDLTLAERVLQQALHAAKEVDDTELIGITMVNVAEAILPHDAVRAESFACSALGHFQHSRNTWRMIECLRLLGSIHQHRGNVEEAARCYRRALGMAKEIGARVEIAALEKCMQRLSSAVDAP
ncbi:MAG: tetratricopeptide repeat protein [Gemmatimonadaceae bacterium]